LITDVCGIPLRYGIDVVEIKTVARVGDMIIAHRHFVRKHEVGDRRRGCMQAVLVRVDLEERGGGCLLDQTGSGWCPVVVN
jgi:hypothetical protein